ncbi:MAG TPA: PQQ-binding-like beta-propeller repeat protein, partial [Solirubrobacteraceae bacterium]|nr:PQQ-binding-like beta-propeller repeat protein [Solirubrobacteraceae bacterium]
MSNTRPTLTAGRALALALAVVATLLALAHDASAAWNQFRGNAARTALARWTAETPPEGRIAWRQGIGSNAMLDASPVIGPTGMIYLGVRQGNNRLVGIHPGGFQRFGVPAGGFDVEHTPAVRADGHVIVPGTNEGAARVFAHDGTTGQRFAWSDASKPAFRTSPLLARDRPYIPWRDNQFMGFDSRLRRIEMGGVARPPVTGHGPSYLDLCFICVDFDTSAPGPSGPTAPAPRPTQQMRPAPAYSSQCNDMVAGPFYGKMIRVHPRGDKLWEKKIDSITTPTLGQAGRMYVVNRDRELQAYGQGGNRLWSRDIGFAPVGGLALSDLPINDGRGQVGTAACLRKVGRSTTVVHDPRRAVDTLYATAADGHLYSFDGTGRLRWKERLGTGIPGAPAIVRARSQYSGAELEQIVVGIGNELQAWQPNGSPIWRVTLDGPVGGTPAVAGDTIYAATRHSLYAIR